MKLDENPVFRKIIIPWYDSEIACLILIIFMNFVLMFSRSGISVAREYSEYTAYIWIPVLLMVLSVGVILSIIFRLVRRLLYYLKYPERGE